jgi:transposase
VVRLLLPLRPRLRLIVIESTGSLHRPLQDALLEHDLPVALVNPARVRYFAKGMGISAKTDHIDARVLILFGQKASPRLLDRRSRDHAELRDLVACRRQLIATRTQQLNRRGSTISKAARASLDAVLRTLDAQVARLDRRIRAIIDADDEFRHLDRLLQGVPGVGPTLSITLAADLRELGTTDRQRVGALAGVAPFPDDSGTIRGRRAIRGGRAGGRPSATPSTWPRSPPSGATRSSARSPRGSRPPGSPARSASSPACGSCSPCSTPWPATASPGTSSTSSKNSQSPLDS